MNILLLYATNSGGTQQVSQMVASLLQENGHTVSVKNPKESNADELSVAGLIIFASPSWDYQDKEGMPHEDFISLLESLKGKTLENKPFAIVGLGDSSYAHFCGAVDEFEKVVQNLKGKLIVPSLKIDGYYLHMDENNQAVRDWTSKLLAALSTH
ncbi:MAG TPA: hypothetical protein DIV47_03085 [Candidatus Pacebacteria bacterium]|nr:hypothetical protein [Candidatus Paceibacterota bacterium]